MSSTDNKNSVIVAIESGKFEHSNVKRYNQQGDSE